MSHTKVLIWDLNSSTVRSNDIRIGTTLPVTNLTWTPPLVAADQDYWAFCRAVR